MVICFYRLADYVLMSADIVTRNGLQDDFLLSKVTRTVKQFTTYRYYNEKRTIAATLNSRDICSMFIK